MNRYLINLTLCCLLLSACGDGEKVTPAPPQETSKATESTPPPAAISPKTEQADQAAQPAPGQAETTIPETTSTPTPVTESDANTAQAEAAPLTTDGTLSRDEALLLARKSGCLACHAIDKKLVGPPWQEVAKRYANDTEAKGRLVEKVKKGGKGNWTDITGDAPMPPYSPRVSDENIDKLVSFVLSFAG